LLDQVVQAPKVHVRQRAVAGGVSGAKGPGAFIGVFVALTVAPCIEVRIGDGFLQFVRDDRSHGVGGGIAIGAGSGL